MTLSPQLGFSRSLLVPRDDRFYVRGRQRRRSLEHMGGGSSGADGDAPLGRLDRALLVAPLLVGPLLVGALLVGALLVGGGRRVAAAPGSAPGELGVPKLSAELVLEPLVLVQHGLVHPRDAFHVDQVLGADVGGVD